MSDALKKTLWEGLRIVLYSAASAFVDFAHTMLLPVLPPGYMTVALTLALKLWDFYIHKNDAIKWNGLLSMVFRSKDLPM